MNKQEIIDKFGFDPESVGNRPRGFFIVESIEEEESQGNAKIGDLCVKTRDGASNPIDPNAFKVGNCVGSAEDCFDRTYRYYYYRAI